jgi:hypothetical protein
MHYRHTQFGSAIIVILALGMLFCLGGIVRYGTSPGSLLALAVLLSCLLTFTALTIEVNKDLLIWYFNFGLISKQVKIADIANVTQVTNSWIHGWGIHRTSCGWLYNVSGLQAIEVRLNTGKLFRLGTNEPEELVKALNNAINQRITRPPA